MTLADRNDAARGKGRKMRADERGVRGRKAKQEVRERIICEVGCLRYFMKKIKFQEGARGNFSLLSWLVGGVAQGAREGQKNTDDSSGQIG